jgi:membrane peptidoglycan carboxypeptidase
LSLAIHHSRRRLTQRRLRAAWPGLLPRPTSRSTLGIAAMCLFGVATLVVVLAVGAAVYLVVWFGQFAGALPPPEELTARSPFQTTVVLAGDGATRLYEITDPQGGRRTILGLDQMPRSLIEATIATEDAGFYSNPGFELRAIVRATLDDLTHQQVLSGASTITQQVVRGVLLSPQERLDLSARRKVKEIALAYQLTHTYTKDQILDVYLNEIYYGNRNYGVEAAAEGYFGKSAANLDLAESALLAGLPQAPSYYDPYQRLDAVKQRQAVVLQRMVDQGYISLEQAQQAADEPLHFVDVRHAVVAPHFVALVSGQLERQLGTDALYHGGDQVTTTLDLKLQTLAEQAVAADLPALRRAGANNVAIVALDPASGQILAMVGSANYEDASIAGQVNMAVAPLPSGGVLRPLTYALALGQGETLDSSLDPTPVGLTPAGATPVAGLAAPNSSVTLRQALGGGLDAPATRIMQLVGNQSLIDLGHRIGIADFERRVSYGPNFTIADARVSPLEVAQAYATLADGGVARGPVAVKDVRTPTGQSLPQPAPAVTPALDPGVAYLITTVLTDPSVRPADEKALDLGTSVAAQVAESEDRRNAWVAGYSPSLVIVAWVGSVNGQPIADLGPAMQVWGDFARAALKLRPPTGFTRPSDVTSVTLCRNPGCTQKQTELVLKGTEAAETQANAANIAQPTPATGSSKTPLVNRR